LNRKDKIIQIKKVMDKYKVPHMQNYTKRAKNAVYLSAHNTLEHELAKAEFCWNLKKEGKQFITEAQAKDNNRIVDIIILDSAEEVEIVKNHLSKKNKADIVVRI